MDECHADIHKAANEGYTPLQRGITRAKTKMKNIMLILLLAIQEGKYAVADFLLEKGANLDHQTVTGIFYLLKVS